MEFYIEESGNYKITKYVVGRTREEAIEEFEDWKHEEFWEGYITLESQDRSIIVDNYRN